MFNQSKYIENYNKANYKMYQFRVRRNSELMEYLDNIKNRNGYLVSLVENDRNKSVLTIRQIREAIVPILSRYGITEISLFGSYARGEANAESDVDIFCDRGIIKTLVDQGEMEDELEKSLGKDVDIVFTTSKMDPFFEKAIREDMIKLCWEQKMKEESDR